MPYCAKFIYRTFGEIRVKFQIIIPSCLLSSFIWVFSHLGFYIFRVLVRELIRIKEYFNSSKIIWMSSCECKHNGENWFLSKFHAKLIHWSIMSKLETIKVLRRVVNNIIWRLIFLADNWRIWLIISIFSFFDICIYSIYIITNKHKRIIQYHNYTQYYE